MRSIHAAKSGVRLVTGKILEGVFFQHFDLLLRPRQQFLAILAEFPSALVRGQGLFKAQVARFHAGNNFFQLRQCRFKTGGLIIFGGFGHIRGNGPNPPGRPEKSKSLQ